MTWMLLAALSSAAYGTMAVIDKRLIDQYMPSLNSYYLWIGIAVFVYGLVFLAVGGSPADAPLGPTLVAAASGLCWGAALAMMFLGYKLQEVSRASALVFTFPVFVALLAVAFLGESLVPLQWVALTVVVAGAILISLGGPSTGGGRKLFRIVPVLLAASLLTALGHLTGKYALQELSVGFVTSLRFLGMAFVLAFFWRRRNLVELRQAMRHKEALVLLILGELIIVPVAILLMMIATKLGPVSLVATITGTRPVFVFFYSTLLSLPRIRVLNESLNRGTLAAKLASVLMIIGGTVLLGLLVHQRFGCICPY